MRISRPITVHATGQTRRPAGGDRLLHGSPPDDFVCIDAAAPVTHAGSG